MTWQAVEEAIGGARAIAFDGCHKIYLAMDDEQVREFRGYGYTEDGSVMIFAEHASPDEMLTYLHNWYNESCSLRFIEAVRTVDGDPNEGFTQLIAQFPDEDEEYLPGSGEDDYDEAVQQERERS